MKKLRISVDGKQYDVEVEILEDTDNQVLPSYFNQSAMQSVQHAAPAAAAPAAAAAPKAKKPAAAATGNGLNSPINGVVLEIPVKVGQKVKSGDVVIVLEAMKMKTNISAPNDAEIASIEVNLSDRVETGQMLVTFK